MIKFQEGRITRDFLEEFLTAGSKTLMEPEHPPAGLLLVSSQQTARYWLLPMFFEKYNVFYYWYIVFLYKTSFKIGFFCSVVTRSNRRAQPTPPGELLSVEECPYQRSGKYCRYFSSIFSKFVSHHKTKCSH